LSRGKKSILTSELQFFFAKSTFFHAGQREKSIFFTLKLLFFTLELLFFTLEAAA
jgi:hypothetical protein